MYTLNLSLASANPGILPKPLLNPRLNLSLNLSADEVISPLSTADLSPSIILMKVGIMPLLPPSKNCRPLVNPSPTYLPILIPHLEGDLISNFSSTVFITVFANFSEDDLTFFKELSIPTLKPPPAFLPIP